MVLSKKINLSFVCFMKLRFMKLNCAVGIWAHLSSVVSTCLYSPWRKKNSSLLQVPTWRWELGCISTAGRKERRFQLMISSSHQNTRKVFCRADLSCALGLYNFRGVLWLLVRKVHWKVWLLFWIICLKFWDEVPSLDEFTLVRCQSSNK